MKNKKVLKFSECQAVKDSLIEAINKNEIALDNVKNWIFKVDDMIKFSDYDNLQEDLATLKYIEYCLEYLGDMYKKSYKQYGGKL